MPKTVRIPRPVLAVCPTTVTFSVLTESDLRAASAVLGIPARKLRRSVCEALKGHGESLETTREVYDRWRARVGSLRVFYVVHSADHVIVTEILVRPPGKSGWVHAELLTG
jgi:mRNA-degrading endonuclease RelE of RelBE toxin-antitoxin system